MAIRGPVPGTEGWGAAVHQVHRICPTKCLFDTAMPVAMWYTPEECFEKKIFSTLVLGLEMLSW